MRWTLEQIRQQAARGGVNRQQAEQLLDRIAELEAAARDVVAEMSGLPLTPGEQRLADLLGADLRLWEHLND